EARARAYLHANCSMCHRAGVAGRATFDVRYSTALRDANICGIVSQIDDMGVAGAKILMPGVPGASLVSLRPHALGAARMPPVASTLVDVKGLDVVDDWIRGIGACP